VKINRIVSNIKSTDPASADAFYRDVLGMDVVMDHGWIRTYASKQKMTVQLSIASEGGSGTSVPDLSIEVDDLDEALSNMALKQSLGACDGFMFAIRLANSLIFFSIFRGKSFFVRRF